MKQAFLSVCLLSLINLSLSGQIIAKKLPAEQNQETISHCGHKSIWIKGHWQWDAAKDTYIWVKGKCEPHKKGYTYIPGRWQKVAEGWKWQEGVWKKI